MDNVALLPDTARCSGRDIAGVSLVHQQETGLTLAQAAERQERMFPVPAGDGTEFDPRHSFKRMSTGTTMLPHGTHPKGALTEAHRTKYGLFIVPQQPEALPQQQPAEPEAQEYYPKWGVWAPVRDGVALASFSPLLQRQLAGMPREYVKCVCEVDKPYELLCGHRKPSMPWESQLVREAVEAMFVGFIERMLVIQLKYLEIHNDYKLLSKDSVNRHAACAMLCKGPTDSLSTTDFKLFHDMCREKVAPFEEALRAYDRPSLLQFFEKELGTLYIFGVPVMSTRVMRTEPGWRQANKFLEIVGSKLRLRLCVLGSSTELLLGEPILERCTANTFVVGAERARTAMLAFEVASTQDTAENPVKMFRTASTAFIVYHKWNEDRIGRRDWNPATYGPTQKVVMFIAQAIIADRDLRKTLSPGIQAIIDSGGDGLRALLQEHCTESLVEYQQGESLVNSYTFTPRFRGVLHALFSRHVPLEDMHSWLVDTVERPLCCGILQSILRSYPKNPQLAIMRLLMYTTDTWFANNRLYTNLMMGCMAASIRNGAFCASTLYSLLAETHALAVKALLRMAERALERFKTAKYRVLSHMLEFDSIAAILTRQYQRNDGAVDETSLRFNSSFWMNILGYYVRLTNSIECLDDEIIGLVHGFLDDVLGLIHAQRPDLGLLALVRSKEPRQDNIVDEKLHLSHRLVACHAILSAAWDRYMRSTLPPSQPQQDEPPAKRQRTDKI
jgi:hypothetical protein